MQRTANRSDASRSRSRLPGANNRRPTEREMKTALAMILTALATVAILRTSASRAPQPSGQVAESQADASIVGPVAASPISQAPSWPTGQVPSSPTGDLPPASAASPAAGERTAPPQPQ